jgi:hypothetical protein
MKKQTVLPRGGLDAIHSEQAFLLSHNPDEGREADLDTLALTAFRLDPPAFLLRSVKQ